MYRTFGIFAAAFVAALLSATPTWAQLDVDLGIADVQADLDTDDGVGLDSDVNLLGDDGVDASADANIGGDSVVDADVDANAGGADGINAEVDGTVGGSDGDLVDADVDLGIGGSDSAAGGGDSGNAGPGSPGSGVVGNASGSGSGVSCIGSNSPTFDQLSTITYSATDVDNWAGAADVRFIPVALCPGLDEQLGSGLLARVAGSVRVLQSALASSSYAASDIVGITQSGATLEVYVN